MLVIVAFESLTSNTCRETLKCQVLQEHWKRGRAFYCFVSNFIFYLTIVSTFCDLFLHSSHFDTEGVGIKGALFGLENREKPPSDWPWQRWLTWQR